ncbi:MAG TPA: carboxypeptidase-like regulatory domain-containing protein [Enhygromyxa sp.]|nr:carboxypeptidase-like regulatory domain-containing protein [Enhygromyxa sp.]
MHRLTLVLLAAAVGCVGGRSPSPRPQHDTISILSPRCAGVRSCVLGHVTASDTAAPVAEAAVFLERESDPAEGEPIRILTLTDEQGVFVVDDPPPGSYRIAIYKGASSVEVAGLELGRDGTTVLPVRLGSR